MNKRRAFFILSFICLLFLGGCKAAEPEATVPPKITNPEGGIISTNPKAVEGQIVKLTDKQMILKVQNVEWKIMLGEKARWELERLAAGGIEIKKGTFVIVYYDENANGEREANRIERLEVN